MTGRFPPITITSPGRVATAFATAAVFLSALTSSALAHADPDPTAPVVDPKAQCESLEVGGVFVTDVKDGVAHSVCQYIVSGYFYYDTFENGAYVGTSVYRDGKTNPTERPVIPEVLGTVNLPFSPFS